MLSAQMSNFRQIIDMEAITCPLKQDADNGMMGILFYIEGKILRILFGTMPSRMSTLKNPSSNTSWENQAGPASVDGSCTKRAGQNFG